MLMVTPCTDWYLLFTGIARGNVPLSASILPMNLILQLALLPLYLFSVVNEFVGEGIFPLFLIIHPTVTSTPIASALTCGL